MRNGESGRIVLAFGAAAALCSCARSNAPAAPPMAEANRAAPAASRPAAEAENLNVFDVEEEGPGCLVVLSQADFQNSQDPSFEGAVRNQVVVDARGRVLWNDVPVDLIRLRQYLDLTPNLRPVPLLIVRSEPGAAPAVVEAVRETIFRSLGCRLGAF